MSRSLRLLFLTQTYPRHEEDTAGPFIRDLARALVRAGDRVTLLTPHATGVAQSWDDGGVEARSFRYAPESWELLGYGRSLERDETVRVGAGLVAPLYAWGARRALARELRRGSWDLIHAHWVVPNGLIAATLSGPGRGEPPLAVGLHGSDVFLAEKPAVRSLVGATLRRTRLLTGCSPELVDRVRRLGFTGDAWRVIPYGVDVDKFAPGPPRQADWRQRLGIPGDAELLLGVGRMATKKGFHLLVDVLPRVLGGCATCHLVLAGGGDRLEELRAASRPFADRVHFPGSVERDLLPDLYRAADLFVLPAVHDSRGNVDGLPNVILEAMASGLPVVASRISGIPLAIDDGVQGRLVEEGDTGQLSRALLDLLADRSAREAAGRQARLKAERELTWDAVAARYRRAYLEVLEPSPAAPARAPRQAVGGAEG